MKLLQPILLIALVLATYSVALPTVREKHLNERAVPDNNSLVQRSPFGFLSVIGRVLGGALGGSKSKNKRSFLEADDELLTRSFEDELYARYASEEEMLEERSFFGKIFGAAKNIGKGLLGFRKRDETSSFSDLHARSSETLEERGFFGKVFGAVKNIGKSFLGFRKRDAESSAAELHARGEELMEERSFFGKIFGAAKNIGKGLLGFRKRDESSTSHLYARDEPLEERGFFGKVFGAVKNIGKGLLGFRKREESSEHLEARFSSDATVLEERGKAHMNWNFVDRSEEEELRARDEEIIAELFERSDEHLYY